MPLLTFLNNVLGNNLIAYIHTYLDDIFSGLAPVLQGLGDLLGAL